MRPLHKILRTAPILVLLTTSLGAKAQRKTENVVLVMSDGVRWQEVFRGAEEALISKDKGGVQNVEYLKKDYWRDTIEERRKALMPFVWNVMAKQGQLYGNRDKGSDAYVTNGLKFSYPGYSETFCGFSDPRINSNNKFLNPNRTVYEFLNGRSALKGKVAAFSAWDVISWTFNKDTCGFPVYCGYEEISEPVSPALKLLDKVNRETWAKWDDNAYDSITFRRSLEYLKEKRPRVFYIGLGETDEWAHEKKYNTYLNTIHQVDAYLKELWDTVQSIPQYRNKTAIIFCPDHGRGDDALWTSHGTDIPNAEYIFIGIVGPDVPPNGEMKNLAAVTQSQIAATMAALVGEDYCAVQPKAAKPISHAITNQRR